MCLAAVYCVLARVEMCPGGEQIRRHDVLSLPPRAKAFAFSHAMHHSRFSFARIQCRLETRTQLQLQKRSTLFIQSFQSTIDLASSQKKQKQQEQQKASSSSINITYFCWAGQYRVEK